MPFPIEWDEIMWYMKFHFPPYIFRILSKPIGQNLSRALTSCCDVLVVNNYLCVGLFSVSYRKHKMSVKIRAVRFADCGVLWAVHN